MSKGCVSVMVPHGELAELRGKMAELLKKTGEENKGYKVI